MGMDLRSHVVFESGSGDDLNIGVSGLGIKTKTFFLPFHIYVLYSTAPAEMMIHQPDIYWLQRSGVR
jgi:hypothetical protein